MYRAVSVVCKIQVLKDAKMTFDSGLEPGTVLSMVSVGFWK